MTRFLSSLKTKLTASMTLFAYVTLNSNSSKFPVAFFPVREYSYVISCVRKSSGEGMREWIIEILPRFQKEIDET